MKKKINDIIDFLITIIMVAIIFANGNILVKYVSLFQVGMVGITALSLLVKGKINFNTVIIIWLFILIDFAASYLYSIYPENTKATLMMIVLSFFIAFYDFDSNFAKRFLRILEYIILIGSISILISVVYPRLILNHFTFFVTNSEERLLKEIAENHYSGLFAEKGNAAFLVSIGIGIIWSKYLCKNIEKKEYAFLIIFLVAIILTNKRMLTAVTFLNMFIMFILSNKENKSVKILGMSIIAITVAFLSITYIPVVSNIFNRFITDDDNGRNLFKNYCIQMYKQDNWKGLGLNTFNSYIYERGARVYNESTDATGRWIYHAHNVYYQLLGETGLIGLSLFVFALLFQIFTTVKYINTYKKICDKDNMTTLQFSLFVQLLFCIYSYTGNTLYYYQQIIIYFMAITMSFNIQKILKKSQIREREEINE